MPDTIIRLSAGRQTLSETEQVRDFVLLISWSKQSSSGDVLYGGRQCHLHWRRHVDDSMLAVGRGMMVATFLITIDLVQDKAMMRRWGLEGMQSFEQKGVRAKERGKIMDQAYVAVEHSTPALVAET